LKSPIVPPTKGLMFDSAGYQPERLYAGDSATSVNN
jgi:hypothetical protein